MLLLPTLKTYFGLEQNKTPAGIHKPPNILYVGICRRCGYLLKATTDVGLFKQRCADHLLNSHKEDLGCFVKGISLKDFSEYFKIQRYKGFDMLMVLFVQNTKGYYRGFRNSNKPSLFFLG